MEEKEATFSSRLPDFDCNICLGFAVDPIITLCGHLYCWPCIYRRLNLDSVETFTSNCPVCKSPFSESTLIPLYGRGIDVNSHRDGIPDRPTEHRKLVAASADGAAADRRRRQQRRRVYPSYDDGRGGSMGIMHSTAGAVLGEMAFGLYGSPEMAAGGRRRRSLQELRVESWLHQLWCFLCCCGLLCLLFF